MFPFAAVRSTAALLTLGACGDDDTKPAPANGSEPSPTSSVGTQTPTATSVLTGGQAGEAGFREFVTLLDAGLRAQGGLAIKARWKTIEYMCAPGDVPPQVGGPACEFVRQRFDGVPSSSWRSEGGLAPVETVNARLDEASGTQQPGVQDAYGSGEMRVFAISIGGTKYKTVATAIIARPDEFGPGPENIRVAWVIERAFGDSGWQATSIMFAYVLSEELLQQPTAEIGGVLPNWERWSD